MRPSILHGCRKRDRLTFDQLRARDIHVVMREMASITTSSSKVISTACPTALREAPGRPRRQGRPNAAAVVKTAGMVGSLITEGDRAGYGRHYGHVEIVARTSGSDSASPLFLRSSWSVYEEPRVTRTKAPSALKAPPSPSRTWSCRRRRYRTCARRPACRHRPRATPRGRRVLS
jgi:hypothetical protein